MRPGNARKGFTLIEPRVVAVIAARAGRVLPRFLPASDDAKGNIAHGDKSWEN
jgi:type II secretory pathway pseudopilin PulG